jgi:O-antigen/teichoic acid export membrane protein
MPNTHQARERLRVFQEFFMIEQPISPPLGSSPLRSLLSRVRNSKLFRNIVTAVSGTAGAQLINLALMPVIMRIYGPESFGVLGTFQSVSMILITVAALTYPTAIVLPRREADAHKLIRLSLKVAACIALSLTVLLVLFGKQIAETLNIEILIPFLLLLPFTMFTGAVLEICQQWLYRTHQFRLTATAATTHALLYNGMRSGAGLIAASPPVLVVTTALYYAVHSCILIVGILLTRKKRVPVPEPEGIEEEPVQSVAKRYRDFPIFRAPQVLINAIAVNMPTLVLASMYGAVPAGFFALCAQVLSMPNNLIGKAVGDVYYPRITQAIHEKEPLVPLLLKGIAGLTAIGFVPFVLLSIIGPWLFGLVFGAQWYEAGEYARWLALAELAGFMARPCMVAIPALELQGRYLIVEIASTVLRIGGAVLGGLIFKDPLGVVTTYAAVNGAINLTVIGLVLVQARKWDRRTAARAARA